MASLMALNQHKITSLSPSLKSETISKLINIIPSECPLISSLPGSALRTHVELIGKPRDVNKPSQSLAL